jgi:ribosome modulation factor
MTDEPQGVTGAVSEGADSCAQGVPRADCPYPPDSTGREEWLKGWDEAAAADT